MTDEKGKGDPALPEVPPVLVKIPSSTVVGDKGEVELDDSDDDEEDTGSIIVDEDEVARREAVERVAEGRMVGEEKLARSTKSTIFCIISNNISFSRSITFFLQFNYQPID